MVISSCIYCKSKNLTDVTVRSDGNQILRCEECRMMMVKNTADDIKALYSADYFEKNEETTVGYSDYWSSPAANMIGKFGLTRLFSSPKETHLDLGCADGSLMEIFKEEGFTTYGLEISKEAVAVAQEKGLNVQESDSRKFPHENNSIDAITAFDVLEHLDDLEPVLAEISRTLSSKGKFIFSTLAVKKYDATEYWFNNSLEHYAYFDEEGLSNVLSEVFGEGNFFFKEFENNGVAEYWGVAKNAGFSEKEKQIIASIKDSDVKSCPTELGYYQSLFYNQVSHFKLSAETIVACNKSMSEEQQVLAKFYNLYFQGKFEKAVSLVEDKSYNRLYKSSVFWQAYVYVKSHLDKLKFDSLLNEQASENQRISEQLFYTREELGALKRSRIVGASIVFRERVGAGRDLIKRSRRGTVSKIKLFLLDIRATIAKMTPEKQRIQIANFLNSKKAKTYQLVENKQLTSNQPLVSVVIPYYNREATIDDTLNSLNKQTLKDVEIIIVDDGSSEAKSKEKIDKIAKEETITVIKQKNQGVAVARNNGIKEASGRYVVCLDSDDELDSTYLEKCALVLELQQSYDIATTYMKYHGAAGDGVYQHGEYDPMKLMSNNSVITAAMFRRSAWEKTDGYKSGIGYEDWEFWLKLAEKGSWAKQIPEELFIYRTALNSRFIDDKNAHKHNISDIKELHKNYKNLVRKQLAEKGNVRVQSSTESFLINMSDSAQYQTDEKRSSVLLLLPWMTFGGAETLIDNFTKELSNDFALHFITGIESKNEWEYKFRSTTSNIYHLPNLLENPETKEEFVINYIRTRNIDLVHIVHNQSFFKMLPRISKEFPDLRIISTFFNVRADHYERALEYSDYIDSMTTDNLPVLKQLEVDKSNANASYETVAIPNGIDCSQQFNPDNYNASEIRSELGLSENDTAIMFIGRLSEEKNPDVFVDVAKIFNEERTEAHVKFFVIGDGAMRKEIEKVCSVGENIEYLGYKQEVAKYLAAADVFILPSSIEGFPLSILEAMAMETAVVSSKVGAVPDIIEEGKEGYCVKPGEAADFVKTLKKLLKGKGTINKMGKNGRKKVLKYYSSTELGKNYKELYRRNI